MKIANVFNTEMNVKNKLLIIIENKCGGESTFNVAKKI